MSQSLVGHLTDVPNHHPWVVQVTTALYALPHVPTSQTSLNTAHQQDSTGCPLGQPTMASRLHTLVTYPVPPALPYPLSPSQLVHT